MIINKTKNSKRNIIWGFLEKILNLLLPFIVRTAMLKILGEEVLGLSGLFTSILQVLNLAELGFSSAVVFNMYKPIAENDTDLICELMRFYKKIYRIIGVVVFAIGLALVPFLRFFIKGDLPTNYNLFYLYFIYLFNAGVSYFLFAYKNCLLNAHQRDDLISKIAMFVNVLSHVLQLLLIFLTKNYYFYVLVLPLSTITNNVAQAIIARKLFPQYICKGNIESDIKRSILKNVSGLMIGKLCLVSRNSFDSIFLSAFAGLTVVAIYGNYYYIMTAVIGVLTMICTSIRAGIGNSVAINTIEKNHDDFIILTFLYMWLSCVCTTCLLCLFQPFMEIWVGKDLMFPIITVILLCVYFYSLCLGDIRTVYSNASGLFWESRFYVLFEAVANIILNFFLGKWLGVNGIILATNITIIFVNFVWGTLVLYKHYFVDISSKAYFAYQIVFATITLLSCFLSYSLTSLIHLSKYLVLFIKGIICLVIPNCLFIIALCFFPKKKKVLGFIKYLLKK